MNLHVTALVCDTGRFVPCSSRSTPRRWIEVIEHDMVVLKCIYCGPSTLWITTVVGGLSAVTTSPLITRLGHLTETISSVRTKMALVLCDNLGPGAISRTNKTTRARCTRQVLGCENEGDAKYITAILQNADILTKSLAMFTIG